MALRHRTRKSQTERTSAPVETPTRRPARDRAAVPTGTTSWYSTRCCTRNRANMRWARGWSFVELEGWKTRKSEKKLFFVLWWNLNDYFHLKESKCDDNKNNKKETPTRSLREAFRRALAYVTNKREAKIKIKFRKTKYHVDWPHRRADGPRTQARQSGNVVSGALPPPTLRPSDEANTFSFIFARRAFWGENNKKDSKLNFT